MPLDPPVAEAASATRVPDVAAALREDDGV